MKRVLISTLVATSLFASDSLQNEVNLLKQQVEELQKTLKKANLSSMKEQISEVKALANNDNLKLSADYRVAVDNIKYELAGGGEASNDALITNRLIIGMKYAPRDDLSFISELGYYKSFGDSANHSQANSPFGAGYANFDWVTNENALDNTIKLREAYFLYFGDKFLGSEIPWTASLGRRPSTNGTPAHLRDGDRTPASPLAHAINVEFDGASFKFDLEKMTGVSGMYFKLCMGRGLSNAKARFQLTGDDYARDYNLNPNVDFGGFIFQPYNDGQYQVISQFAKAMNLIGFTKDNMAPFMGVMGGYTPNSFMNYMMSGDPTALSAIAPEDMMGYQMGYMPQFRDLGNMYYGTVTFMANGIGDMINDFLDDTKFFASFSFSQTEPNNAIRDDLMTGMAQMMAQQMGGDPSQVPTQYVGMLGSNDKETGTSVYLGLNMPAVFTESGRIGVEYNHGSKYWRSMTYGEDTMIGSKLATRGDAYELYYTQPLLGDILDMQIRYTYIDYEYTGSNMFFGDEGMPLKIADNINNPNALMNTANAVDEAQDIRVYFRYRY